VVHCKALLNNSIGASSSRPTLLEHIEYLRTSSCPCLLFQTSLAWNANPATLQLKFRAMLARRENLIVSAEQFLGGCKVENRSSTRHKRGSAYGNAGTTFGASCGQSGRPESRERFLRSSGSGASVPPGRKHGTHGMGAIEEKETGGFMGRQVILNAVAACRQGRARRDEGLRDGPDWTENRNKTF
jgi:hypothetical protein